MNGTIWLVGAAAALPVAAALFLWHNSRKRLRLLTDETARTTLARCLGMEVVAEGVEQAAPRLRYESMPLVASQPQLSS